MSALFRCAAPFAALVFAAGAAATPAPQGELRRPHAAVAAPASIPSGLPVTPGLAKRLAAGAPVDYVIEMSARADLSRAAGMSWQERGRYVVDTLKATADASQAPVRRALLARGVAFEAHWIKNAILVQRGDLASAKLAATLPGVARLRELPETVLVRPRPGKPVDRDAKGVAGGVPENIAWIGAPQAWAEGTRGHGVTVGVIDTGALHTHEALRQQYRGWRGGEVYEHDYNWYFPLERNGTPVPGDTHGTHVIGTAVGDDHDADPAARDRIGVAPGAKWIACLGLPQASSSAESLLSCGEFMLAPTRTDGSEPRPDLRPQVINNSWAENNCDGEATGFYADVVDAWVASGIFPVFATGNTFSCEVSEPPGLSTISSPAALPASFAVGSTGNHDGAYAPHSLWGPSSQAVVGDEMPPLPDPRGFPRLKPQVLAPGVDIVSAFDFSDGSYGTMTGTSMSSPHIAGLMALMLDAGECLLGDYATVGTLITETARPLPYASGGMPAPGPGDVPNYATGWGEIDAPAAVAAAANECGPQGIVAGVVRDAGGAPVGGARVELFVDRHVRVWEVMTEPDGGYARRLPEDPDGRGYTLRVTAYGFLPYARAGVPVLDEQTTVADVELERAPLATLSGRVTDAVTGWPLLARLSIAGYPGGEIWTDAVTGEYTVELPTAASYRIDVGSGIDGYLPATREVDFASDRIEHFALAADAVACVAPGYGYGTQRYAEDFESGTPPTGWTTSSAGAGWTFGTRDELHDPRFFVIPPRDGRFAASVEPAPQSHGANDGRYDYLVSPPIDLRGTTDPVVRFASRYWASGLEDGGAHVQASNDGGATWQALGSPPQVEPTWTEEALSLAPFAGDAAVQLRFHYDDGSTATEDLFNPGWAVDDVRVVAGCSAPNGGSLVVGHVRDANTQDALDGAVVSIGGRSVATRSSAARGAGFFAIHAPAGTTVLAATRGSQPSGYGDGERTLVVGDGATLETSIELPAGVLRFDAAAGPQATLELGTTATVPFTLRNDGTLGLAVTLEGTHLEEHFDALEFPPAGWSASDNGEGCAWQRGDFNNGAGGDGPFAEIDLSPCYDGARRIDHALALPPVDLSGSASASLGFFLGLGAGWLAEPYFAVEASTDGGATWAALREWDYGNAGHELIELDLSQYAGTADLRLRFRLEAQPPYATLAIDQVHVFREIGEDTAVDVTPAQATLAPGATRVAAARFDAGRVAQPGVYTIPIRVGEDTPYAHAFGELEATMTVTTPAGYGSIAGTVRSLGRCEAVPQAFADLPVRIVAGNGVEMATRTDVDGRYRYFVDAANGPYTVHLADDAHQPAQRSVAVAAGQETAADFDLRPLAACVASDPAVLHVAAVAGQQATTAFRLGNLGPVAGAFSVRAGGDPTMLSVLRPTQNDAGEPEQNASVACVLPATQHSLENRWARVYPLRERGYAGDTVMLDGVRFGTDSAHSVAGTQQVVVSAYALQGDFVRANLTLLASTTVTLPDGLLLMRDAAFDAPVAVPTDATLVVEIAKLDGIATSSTFYPAGNFAADTAPAWYYAPDCDTFEPTSYDALGFEALSPIIDPILRASDACGVAAQPVDWLAATPASGEVPGDGDATLQAQADAGGFVQGTQHGAFCIATPNATDRELVLPVELHVGAPLEMEIFESGFEG